MGRHTFATTVPFTNNVPIETVIKMLGHSSLKTTQIYAKVVEKKVSEDMNGQYQPEVTVTAKVLGEKVQIKVSDNDTGIPENIKSKIFSPFLLPNLPYRKLI